MLLVLAAPDPVAQALVPLLSRKGERVAVVAGAEFAADFGEDVVFFEGDSAAIDFGLSGEQYRQLLSVVTHAFLAHSGISAGGEVERSRVVRQAAELREFVRAGGAPSGVVFLSSLLIFGNARGTARESDFRVGQRFLDEHEEALAVAERMVQSLKNERTLTVLRTAPVVGSELDGSLIVGAPLSHLVGSVKRAAEERGFTFADLPVRFDTIERVAAALSDVPLDDVSRVYHLVDEEPLTDRQLIAWISDYLQRPAFESIPAPRRIAALLNRTYPGSRALTGWGLHFDRENAKKHLGHLLDRDETAVLRRLFPPHASVTSSSSRASHGREDHE